MPTEVRPMLLDREDFGCNGSSFPTVWKQNTLGMHFHSTMPVKTKKQQVTVEHQGRLGEAAGLRLTPFDLKL